MQMKLSDYVADFLAANGIRHIFTVTGGGAMHLNDSLGHHEKLECIYNHHEQASAIAAEGYTRLTGKLAAVCVTSGPGGTNAITGVLGGWLDSIPMFIISGQVKRETTLWSAEIPLRQLGDQEYPIVESVKPMTKYAQMITDPAEIRYHLEKALYLCKNGRGGPVWLDIPLDVQAAVIDTKALRGFDEAELQTCENPIYEEKLTKEVIRRIQAAKRPLILAGTGVRLADAHEEFLQLISRLDIPVVTAWNAQDLLEDENPLNCGRPGTVGTRGGNFVVQNCDLLLILGCRMNIRMIGYNFGDFAKNAYKVMVDIDANEMRKPTISIDMPIHADVKDFMRSMLQSDTGERSREQQEWKAWARRINQKYPAVLDEYYEKEKPLNPYVFIKEFFECLPEGTDIVCGNGSACVVTFQAAVIKKNQRLFTNSGCAAMGYGFPAAIGAYVAGGEKEVICIDGDGSFQMNIQELQTVVYRQMNIKIIYLNNNGYHSIRQTQTNIFKRSLVGVCDGNGLSFPEIRKIAEAYGIAYVRIDSADRIKAGYDEMMEHHGPVICEVIVDQAQNFAPKLSSRVQPDGKIVSPSIDDMFPFLDREEYEAGHCKSF